MDISGNSTANAFDSLRDFPGSGLFTPPGPHPAALRIHDNSRLISAIFENCSVAFCMVGLDRAIRFANPAFRTTSRAYPTLANCRTLSVSHAPDSLDLRLAIEAAIQDGTTRTVLMTSQARSCGLPVLVAPLPGTDMALITIAPLQNAAPSAAHVRKALQTRWSLSPREADSAILLSQGKSAAIIAQDRGVSLPTIRTQLQAIREKLGAKSSLEAAAIISNIGRAA